MPEPDAKNNYNLLEPPVSICSAGQAFPLAPKADYDREFERVQQIVQERCSPGQEIIVVMGVGFVGRFFRNQ
ncbi:MAG: hypothetical protein OEW45_02990 [Deltaproteobacteria bacterium]|nr:hypothetical protein [Deltaproteobacteria bacterium]